MTKAAQERHRSVAGAGLGALQRLGELQKRLASGGEGAAVARSVAVARKQQLQRAGVFLWCMQRLVALQERCCGPEAAVAASWSVAGALQ